jgi:hypothetical protein
MNMWGKYRRGKHLSIAVPPEIKNQLIRRKALGEGGIGAQIVEALQLRWGGAPLPPPAVITNPAVTPAVIESGPYKGMRHQPIRPQDPQFPKIPQWNL